MIVDIYLEVFDIYLRVYTPRGPLRRVGKYSEADCCGYRFRDAKRKIRNERSNRTHPTEWLAGAGNTNSHTNQLMPIVRLGARIQSMPYVCLGWDRAAPVPLTPPPHQYDVCALLPQYDPPPPPTHPPTPPVARPSPSCCVPGAPHEALGAELGDWVDASDDEGAIAAN